MVFSRFSLIRFTDSDTEIGVDLESPVAKNKPKETDSKGNFDFDGSTTFFVANVIQILKINLKHPLKRKKRKSPKRMQRKERRRMMRKRVTKRRKKRKKKLNPQRPKEK